MIKALMRRGERLAQLMPSQQEYARIEKRIKDKYRGKKQTPLDSQAKKQIQMLWRDHKKRENEVASLYTSWFREGVQALHRDGTLQSEFKKTKSLLGFDKKVRAGIIILGRYEKKHSGEEKHDWVNVLQQGESDRVEFKSSFRWDYRRNELNRDLEPGAIKTIAAFLNSKGGTLFFGVNDKGDILGLEKDYPTLKRKDGDGFIQYLLQVINNCLGKEYNQYISAKVISFQKKELCVVQVHPAESPVFMKLDNNEHFYIRASLSSQPLNVREAVEYIRMHFK